LILQEYATIIKSKITRNPGQNGHNKATIPVIAVEAKEKLWLIPDTVWVVTPLGLVEDHRRPEIEHISRYIEDHYSPNDCLIWRGNKPEYLVMQTPDGLYVPIPFPTAETIKTTPSALYAKAITYTKTLRRLLKRRLKGDKDILSRTSKMVWMGGLIAIVLFIVFMVLISMISPSGSGQVVDPGVVRYGPPADLTIPSGPGDVARPNNPAPARGEKIE